MSMDHKVSARRQSVRWTVRPMRVDDIDKCLEIWKEVELTEARQTLLSALVTDPEGFYVAQLEPSEQVVGMCSGTITRPDTAFMGFYAVEPNYQGLGVGRELWARTTERFGNSTNIGLYGVPSMSRKYVKSGFKVEDSIRMLIYESDPNDDEGELASRLDQLSDLSQLKLANPRLQYRLEMIDRNTSEEIFNKLLEYDSSVNSFSRDKLLRNYLWCCPGEGPLTFAIIRDKWFHCGEAKQQQQVHSTEKRTSCCAKPSQESIVENEALANKLNSSLTLSASNMGDSHPDDNPSRRLSPMTTFEVIGYGCIRSDNTSGAMIGPIYADSYEISQILLKNLIKHFKLPEGAKYSVMALSSNPAACSLLESIGLSEMDQCSRMFTRFVPTADYSKIYYVHSPNFTLF